MKLIDLLLILFFTIVFLLMPKDANADAFQLKSDTTIPFNVVIVSSNVSLVMSPEQPAVSSIINENSPNVIKSEHFVVIGVAMISAYYIFQAWLANKYEKFEPMNGNNHISFKLEGSTYVLIKCDGEPEASLYRTLSVDSEAAKTSESYV